MRAFFRGKPALGFAGFLCLVLAFAVALDALALAVMRPFFIRCGRFWLDDFEITQKAHPEAVWDRVFYGSSIVIAGYREEESGSGYINCGMDNATVRDLQALLAGGYIRIGSELVLGVDELTLYDDFPTNPNYIWHKKWYEPYCYFARSRFQVLLQQTAEQFLGVAWPPYPYLSQEKGYYWGAMGEAELREKLKSPSYLPYLALSEEDFDENFAALDWVWRWCGQHGVRLRILFMPANPVIEPSVSVERAKRRLETFCAEREIEYHDKRDDYDAECFYDSSHFNREYGSHRFTKEIDPWLSS